jgi:alkanesulfonate monooxygenase SsuD/methylene tetrahydromethanopterin reductase-like flavin-dependent oxidoreductase (luciferase family)
MTVPAATITSTSNRRASIGMCFDRTFPPSAVAEFATRLEDGGADELWFIEDCFFTTAPPLAASALSVTERLTVGLGILPAVARTAAVTAMEIATLAGLGPGRVVGGVGHGVQSWMAQMGVATPSPLTTLEEVLTAVRRLLRGETVSVTGREVTLDEVQLEHPPTPVPPVVAGVRGPRSLAVAGRVADGVLLDGPCPPEYVRWARAQCAAGDDFQIRCFATLCVAADRPTAYGLVAPLVAELLDQGHAGLARHPQHREMVRIKEERGIEGLAGMPADWWSGIGAIGTLDDAHAYVAALEAEGVTSISLFPAPVVEVARRQVEDVVALAAR